ncbi:ParA family protein [uncultured Marivirga sp.]|uniref:ParA family protein n=1 Tax=uncultured Marivirga sp. TaxID=1123707 RepID=UPI0030EB5ECB|tara:strand:- start:5814 stop:6629 length:816 start_codon:yes stop_codon:yes gene_type:complete
MKVISFINMKGGVGKTTSTVEIGALLAKEHYKKVLIIDIDPQTNSTLSLISLEKWEELKDSSTIADVLGMNNGMTSREEEYDINDAIVSNVGGVNNLDLIPSHLELTFLDLDLVSVPARESVLKNKLEGLATEYDYILIDCPPNLTLAPQNALIISDFIIVPVVPEIFPSIGLPLLVNRINKWKRSFRECNVEFLGVVFTKVDGRYSMHSQQMDALRRKDVIDCFSTVIPQNADLGKAAAINQPATMTHPYCNGVESYRTLVKEILRKINS